MYACRQTFTAAFKLGGALAYASYHVRRILTHSSSSLGACLGVRGGRARCELGILGGLSGRARGGFGGLGGLRLQAPRTGSAYTSKG